MAEEQSLNGSRPKRQERQLQLFGRLRNGFGTLRSWQNKVHIQCKLEGISRDHVLP
jgi:hypothetical protein